MKQMTSGMIAFLGVLAVAGCYSYSSEAINNANYNTVQATPQFAVVKVGDSDQMIVRLVNDANNGAVTSYTISNVGAGIQVHYQDTYRPVFDAKLDTLVKTGDKTAQQYFIVGVAPGKWTFTITPTSVNTGVSATVTAIVSPINIGGALSRTTGLNAGDTVTITAPANTVFSRTSAVTFQVGPAPAVVGISADSTSIQILVAPGDSGTASVTKVGLPQSPSSPLQTLSTTNSISKVPAITVAPTTASTLTPTIGTPFTLTLGNNLRFLPSATVSLGGTAAIITGISADSSTATVVTQISGGSVSSGAISYTNIVLKFLNTVPLSIPGDKTITPATPAADATVGDIATAPTITLGAAGKSIYVGGSGPFVNSGPCAGYPGSGDGCAWYKVVVTATTVVDVDLRWQGGADLGLYIVNSTGATGIANADALGQGASGQPEIKVNISLAPGTYYFGVVFYGVNSGYGPSANTVAPTYYQFKVATH